MLKFKEKFQNILELSKRLLHDYPITIFVIGLSFAVTVK